MMTDNGQFAAYVWSGGGEGRGRGERGEFFLVIIQ